MSPFWPPLPLISRVRSKPKRSRWAFSASTTSSETSVKWLLHPRHYTQRQARLHRHSRTIAVGRQMSGIGHGNRTVQRKARTASRNEAANNPLYRRGIEPSQHSSGRSGAIALAILSEG